MHSIVSTKFHKKGFPSNVLFNCIMTLKLLCFLWKMKSKIQPEILTCFWCMCKKSIKYLLGNFHITRIIMRYIEISFFFILFNELTEALSNHGRTVFANLEIKNDFFFLFLKIDLIRPFKGFYKGAENDKKDLLR